MVHILLIVVHILFIIGMAFFTGRLLSALLRLIDHEFGGARLTRYRFEIYRRNGFTAIAAIIVFVVLYFFVPY